MSDIEMLLGLTPLPPAVGGRLVSTAKSDEVDSPFVNPARGVFQQASGEWYFRVSHAGTKYREAGFKTQKQAVRARDAFERKIGKTKIRGS